MAKIYKFIDRLEKKYPKDLIEKEFPTFKTFVVVARKAGISNRMIANWYANECEYGDWQEWLGSNWDPDDSFTESFLDKYQTIEF